MNNKKAFELEFHWIFILIAGGVILTFFFVMAQKQKTLSNERLANTLSAELESAFVAALQSKGTAQLLNVPFEGITLSCGKTNLCDCNYYILGKQNPFNEKILFGPANLHDAQATIWTLDWKAPFRATNFLYLSNAQTEYIIVTGSNPRTKQLEIKLAKDLPTTLKTRTVENIDTLPARADHLRIIFLTQPDISTLSRLGNDVSAVYISQTNIMTFYTRQPNNDFVETDTRFVSDPSAEPAVNDALLYAAIFTENPHLYDCQFNEAFKKLTYVNTVIKNRAEKIQHNLNKPQCVYPLDTLASLTQTAQKTSQGCTLQDPRTCDASSFIPIAQTLQNQNKILLTQNCPVLY